MAKSSNLAVAYDLKKRNAKSEKRPMPSERDQDSKMVGRNSGNKASSNDDWASNVTVKQAQKPSITKLSQPKIVKSDAFSVRNMNMRDDENDLGDRMPPESDLAQPVKRDDEMDASKSGQKVSDMAAQHNNKKAPYIKEIEDQYAQDMAAAEMKKVQSYAAGGVVMQPEDNHEELIERDDEAHLQDMQAPSEDEGDIDARSRNEIAQEESAGRVDMEKEHSNGRKPYARGGEVSPEDEVQEEHHASVAAAIMARKKMAEGGQVDLSRNADEEPNHEDEQSFEALKKENYSESAGLDELDSPMDSNEHSDDIESDKHDRVSAIRRKMKSKR